MNALLEPAYILHWVSALRLLQTAGDSLFVIQPTDMVCITIAI